MPLLARHRLIIGALLLLLTVSAVGNVILYGKASRPLFAEGDRPLIERTVAHFAALNRTSDSEVRAQSFPLVLHLSDRTCVELRRDYGRGHRGACYDRRDRLLEEVESVGDF